MIETQDVVLAELTRALVEQFAPERIVLFGSRARGDHHPESDYDLLLVLETKAPPSLDVVRRALEDLRVSADVFIDTRERFERRRRDVGTLEYAADHDGRILHSRPAASEARHVREVPGGPPESLPEWIERAHSDFRAMTALARADADASLMRDVIVFHAHQGVEKLLKAALVARRVPPPRTHDLTELLARLPSELRHDRRMEEACRGLQALWPTSRYPHEPMPTAHQVDQAIGWAGRAREILSTAISRS